MREIKTFFSQGNSLNKGYAADNESFNEDENSPANIARRKMLQNLPPVEIISTLEEAHPGTFEKLLEAVEKEQTHRHNAEMVNVQMYAKASAMGRLFSFFVICTICYTSFQLAMNNMLAGGLTFAAIAFACVFGVSFMVYYRSSNRSFNDRRKNNDRFQPGPSRTNGSSEKDTEKKEGNEAFKHRSNSSQRTRRR